MDLPQVSHSMRSLYKYCPRKVYFRYVAGIEKATEKSTSLSIGRSYHDGLEQWRKGVPIDEVVHQAYLGLETNLSHDYDVDIVQDECSKLEAYLRGYVETYHDLGDGIDWQPELKLENNTHTEVAYLDAVYIDSYGITWVVEDKTRSIFDSGVEMAIKLDEQLLSYACMLNSNGFGIPNFVYREVLKSRLKRHKNESSGEYRDRLVGLYTKEKDKFYREFTHTFTIDDIKYYREKRNQLNATIRQKLIYAKTFDRWPHNSQACLGKYGHCDFLPLCSEVGSSFINSYCPNDKTPLDGGWMRKHLFGDI